MENSNKKAFIKVGRIYWIKPKPIFGMEPKIRPAIALSKHDDKRTIFLQLGSTNFKQPDSQKVSAILHQE